MATEDKKEGISTKANSALAALSKLERFSSDVRYDALVDQHSQELVEMPTHEEALHYTIVSGSDSSDNETLYDSMNTKRKERKGINDCQPTKLSPISASNLSTSLQQDNEASSTVNTAGDLTNENSSYQCNCVLM